MGKRSGAAQRSTDQHQAQEIIRPTVQGQASQPPATATHHVASAAVNVPTDVEMSASRGSAKVTCGVGRLGRVRRVGFLRGSYDLQLLDIKRECSRLAMNKSKPHRTATTTAPHLHRIATPGARLLGRCALAGNRKLGGSAVLVCVMSCGRGALGGGGGGRAIRGAEGSCWEKLRLGFGRRLAACGCAAAPHGLRRLCSGFLREARRCDLMHASLVCCGGGRPCKVWLPLPRTPTVNSNPAPV